MATTLSTISWYQGNTKNIHVDVKDVNTGDPIDLTGAAVRFVLASKQSGTVRLSKTVGNGVTVSGNTFTVAIAPTDTATLPVGDYVAQATVTLGNGTVITVLDVVVILKAKYA